MRFSKKIKIISLCFSFCLVFFPNFSFASIFNKTPKDSLKKGLVGWWSMDGKNTVWTSATAGTVTDLSGNGFTGTLTSMNIATNTTQGKIGQAIRFSRGGTQITVADNSSLTFSTGSGPATIDKPFTFSVWVKRDNIGSNHTILSKTGILASLTPFEYVFNIDSSNKLVMTLYDTSGTNQISLTSNSSLETDVGKWVHYVVTYSGGASPANISFYRNAIALPGTTASAGSYVGMQNSTQSLRIGNAFSSDPANKAPMNGAIEDLRIFNRVLSSNEILNLYNQGAGSRASVTPKSFFSLGLNSGLVGRWTFDGSNLKNNVTDLSGQGNNGNMQNFAATSTVVVQGKVGQALKFDGVDDFVNIPASSSLNNLSAISISGWMYANTQSGSFAAKGSSNGTGWFFGRDSNNSMVFYVQYDTTTLSRRTAVNSFDTGRWNHWAVVWDGSSSSSNIHIYKNGVEQSYSAQSSGTVSRSSDSANAFTIGKATNGSNKLFGMVDEVVVYNRVLSASEIQQLYNQGAGDKINVTPKIIGSTGLNSGILGWWTFDGKDMLNGTVLDRSGNGNTGTLQSIATTTFYTLGKIGQAFKFDGVNDRILMNSDFIGINPITFLAWIKPSSLTVNDGLNHFILSNGRVRIYAGTSNQIRVNSDGSTNASSASNMAVVGKWTFVTVTIDASGVVNIYNNGVLSGSANQSSGSRSTGFTNVNIGALNGGTTPFNGIIDDVRIYNRILSTQEILQIYNQGK